MTFSEEDQLLIPCVSNDLFYFTVLLCFCSSGMGTQFLLLHFPSHAHFLSPFLQHIPLECKRSSLNIREHYCAVDKAMEQAAQGGCGVSLLRSWFKRWCGHPQWTSCTFLKGPHFTVQYSRGCMTHHPSVGAPQPGVGSSPLGSQALPQPPILALARWDAEGAGGQLFRLGHRRPVWDIAQRNDGKEEQEKKQLLSARVSSALTRNISADSPRATFWAVSLI